MKAMKYFLLFGLCAVLMACEPMVFGMPQSQFNQLTNEQQQEVIRGYNKQQEIAERNRALNIIAGGVAGALESEVPRHSRRHSHTTSRTTGPVCHWEGNTKVCKQDSSSRSSSSGFSF